MAFIQRWGACEFPSEPSAAELPHQHVQTFDARNQCDELSLTVGAEILIPQVLRSRQGFCPGNPAKAG